MNWIILALLSAIFWGLSYSLIEKVLVNISATLLTFYSSLFVCVSMIVILLIKKENFSPNELLKSNNLYYFLGSESCFVIANLCILYSIAKSKNATISSLIEITYPMWVLLFSFLIFRECKLNFGGVIGGILIFIGIIILSIYNNH